MSERSPKSLSARDQEQTQTSRSHGPANKLIRRAGLDDFDGMFVQKGFLSPKGRNLPPIVSSDIVEGPTPEKPHTPTEE